MDPASVYDGLIDALRERIEIIGDSSARSLDATAHLERLKNVSERIAQIEQSLPPETDPQLRHFLQRCSYEKALALLEKLTAG